MIEAALVLTTPTGRRTDFGIILALLLLNGVVGFWEEHQAANAIGTLRQRLAKHARVMRDGQWSTVPADDLVPGDLIAVERGDVVPADGRVVAGTVEAGSRSPVTSRSPSPARAAGCDPPGPATVLLVAVIGTLILATLIAAAGC